MSSRHPLAAAAGIAALATLAAALGLGATLAIIGYPAVDADQPAATGWDGAYDAAGDDGENAPTPDDPGAVALLDRAVQAGRSVAYQGRTLTGGNGIERPVATAVAGVPGVGTIVTNDRGAAVLAGQGRSSSLADATRVLDLLVANFRVDRDPTNDRTVAGRAALGLVAARADGTPAARFWFDRGTGLLVRRDVLGRASAVVNSTWFDRLTLGAPALAHLPPYAVDAWSHVLDATDRAQWRAAGCGCAEALPDGLTLLAARTDDAGAAAGPGRGVVHLLYSDGLTELSVFEQPGTLDGQGTDTLSSQGFESVTYGGVAVLRRVLSAAETGVAVPTGEWVWVCGASVVTVVAPAVPRAAAERRVERVVTALYGASLTTTSAVPAEDGLLAAVRRGWGRVTKAVSESWEHLRSSSGLSQVVGVGSPHGHRDALPFVG